MATMVAGLLLVSVACTPPTQQVSTSPETSPETSPTAAASPSTEASPSTAPVSPIPAALKITSLPFHAGEVGVPYATVNMLAAGGVTPYVWSITSGFLPAGLWRSGSAVGGTPTSAATWSFTARVVDAAGHSASAVRSIAVARHLVASQSCPTSKPCSVEAGCVTVCGKFGALAGGVGPFAYRLSSGAIPTGMGRSGLSLTGAFPAPATRGGSKTWTFTINVTDALGARGSVSAAFTVFPHIAFTTTSAFCTGYVVSGCTTQLQYTGGTPNGTPTVKVTQSTKYPPLPKGSSFIAKGGVVYVSIAGPGCAVYGNTGYFSVVTLVLVDQSRCGPNYNCSSGSASVTIRLAVC